MAVITYDSGFCSRSAHSCDRFASSLPCSGLGGTEVVILRSGMANPIPPPNAPSQSSALEVRARGRRSVNTEPVQVQCAVRIATDRTRREVGERGSCGVLHVASVGAAGLFPRAIGDGDRDVGSAILLERNVAVVVHRGAILDRRDALVVILVQPFGGVVERDAILEHVSGAARLVTANLEAIAVPRGCALVIAVVVRDAVLDRHRVRARFRLREGVPTVVGVVVGNAAEKLVSWPNVDLGRKAVGIAAAGLGVVVVV